MTKLPRFCYLKQAGTDAISRPGDQAITDMLGENYQHMHHYCWGVNWANRADRDWDNKIAQSYDLQVAAANFNYVLEHATPGFFMRPEIHLRLGKVLLRTNNHVEAAQNFLKAIQIKPDYVPAYLALSDFYKETGSLTQARSLLEEGLKQVPSSRILARHYQELGGKLPLPEAPPPATEASQPGTQPIGAIDAEKKVVEAAPVAAPHSSMHEQAPPSENPSEKIGTPSNPWCRFCTDAEPASAGK